MTGRPLLFGNTSALYDNDMVMFDHGTGSYWHQLSGQAIVGTLAGERLTPLPSLMATFGQWRALHPGTRVLSNTFTQASGAGDPLPGIQQRADAGRSFFPLSEGATGDDRLTLGTQVLLLRVSGEWKAYPLFESRTQAANDRVRGVPLVLFSQETTAVPFFSTMDGRVLIFIPQAAKAGQPQTFEDEQTGSTWDLAGRAVAGELEGTRLELIPARQGFWFAVAGANPGVAIYGV